MRLFVMLTNALTEAIRHPFRACLFVTVGYMLFFVVLSAGGALLFGILSTGAAVIYDPLHAGPAALLLLAIIAIPVLLIWRWCRVHLPQRRPQARGARWASAREMRQGGFLGTRRKPGGPR